MHHALEQFSGRESYFAAKGEPSMQMLIRGEGRLRLIRVG